MKLITMIVGSKAYGVTKKMANTTLELAEKKFKEENANAIFGVLKNDILVLRRDIFKDTVTLDKEVENWTSGGYECYYTKAKMEVK